MPQTRVPYSPEFRRQMIDLVRAGHDPEELAREFEPTSQSNRDWVVRVLGVSEAGYHAWRRRAPSAHAVADKMLLKRVRTLHTSSRETYGVPRVQAELRAGGERHGRKRIARLMRIAVGCDNEYWPTCADEFWPSLPCLTC